MTRSTDTIFTLAEELVGLRRKKEQVELDIDMCLQSLAKQAGNTPVKATAGSNWTAGKEDTEALEELEASPKKRGRPARSKNRVVSSEEAVVASGEKKRRGRKPSFTVDEDLFLQEEKEMGKHPMGFN